MFSKIFLRAHRLVKGFEAYAPSKKSCLTAYAISWGRAQAKHYEWHSYNMQKTEPNNKKSTLNDKF
jgi:hypothetical protein